MKEIKEISFMSSNTSILTIEQLSKKC